MTLVGGFVMRSAIVQDCDRGYKNNEPIHSFSFGLSLLEWDFLSLAEEPFCTSSPIPITSLKELPGPGNLKRLS